MKTDEEIAALVQKGDIQAFSILVQRYEAKMLRYARKFINGSGEEEDAVQEVFLKAYENIQSFDITRKFSTWLYRIAHNQFVNVLKKRHRLPLFFDLDTFFPHIGKDINEEIDRKDMRKALDKCLKELDFKYREIITLYYFEELNYKEIAEVLHIPVSTVGVRLKRARKILKGIYIKYV